MKIVLSLILITISLLGQTANQIFKDPLSPRNANYAINVTLLPESQRLIGKEIITWRNITSKPTDKLQFHLYLNGFSHDKTTFMVESGGKHRSGKFNTKFNGYNKISSFKIGDTDFTEKIEFIQPDDNNTNDSTVFQVQLDKLVQPNETLEITIEFNAKLPQVFARTGHADLSITKDFFLVAQWFPKIGVLEETGWNCHQFHGNTEFFSDYGIYDVTISTPKRFVIGATGLLSSQSNTDSTKTVTYHAEDVHDFAWTAYPDFKVHQEKYNDVSIRFLYNEDDEADVEAQVQSLKYGIDYFQEYFGEYPYPNITFLNPPPGATEAGGK